MKNAFKETELVHLLTQKDENAFHYLYDRYAGALYGELLSQVNNKEIAAILLENVFVKVIRDIKDYNKDKCRFFTWLMRVAQETVAASTEVKSQTLEKVNKPLSQAIQRSKFS